ncbi:DUF488 domain-containing protein [Chitinophaga lutea]|uniref:DUF488 domain-containing protein n=1 Tax=Chitinophaga lutea TaxID=2488634 RepID=A0A3N4PPQ0_9BACT|nr:DUF488 domain-containing protein [Chitinophaga lutea]RPE09698.1 DUF488 domain-containing protein [Chitinophaga lutea]
MINIKRVYEPAQPADGFRILVDRLWPRGIKKETAQVDLWAKEVAPSTELRKWFHHEEQHWPEFVKRYKAELKASDALAALLPEIKKHKAVTLLYGAKDEENNQAVVLRELLKAKL